MDQLQMVLLCAHEVLDAREWGKRTRDPWSIQVEIEWAEELNYFAQTTRRNHGATGFN